MKIIDIVNGPWAITPPMLNEIRNIYSRHLRGDKINIKDVEASIGKKLENKEQGYDLIGSTAIIPVEGVIAKKMNLFMRISGGASTQLIERDIRDALNDPAVEKIILNIDSPGGTVDGTFELADFIYEQRGKKPIIAFTDGIAASAAYAIASAADAVFISGDTTAVGSIGIIAAHEDISKMEEKIGVKTTEIYSGKYKRIISLYAPLSDEGRKALQNEVDYLYSVFIETVAKFRGTTPEDVLSRMSTDSKRIFIGKQAIDAGLVDGVSTLQRLIDQPSVSMKAFKAGAMAGDVRAQAITEKEAVMDLKELKEKHPDIYTAVFNEGKVAGIDEGKKAAETELRQKVTDAKKAGAESERLRIKAVKEQAMPGHEALIETLMFDGETTGEQAAMKVLASEKTLRQSKLDAFNADGKDVKVPAQDSAADAIKTMKRSDYNNLTPADQRAFVTGGGKVTD